jgi:hypothetical protein
MANDVKVMSAVSKEILRQFDLKCIVGNTTNRQYDDTCKYKGAAAGSTINIKQIQRLTVSDGATLVIQDLEERLAPLARTTQKHIGLAFTSQELTQDLVNPEGMAMFAKDYLDSAIDNLAAAVDTAVLSPMALASYGAIGTPGTNPAAYADITDARAELQQVMAPSGDRHYVANPKAIASINAGTSNLFNPTSEKSSDYRTGHLKSTNDFDIWSTDFLPSHTNGDADDATATMTGVTAEGATTIATTGWGATDKITEGTRLTIAGVRRANLVSGAAKADLQVFIVTADTTAVATAMTIPVQPAMEATGPYKNIDALPADLAVITVLGAVDTTYDLNLFYHRDAHVFATQDLKHIGTPKESYIRDDKMKITMKLTMDGDITNFKAISRLDILYGYAALQPEWSFVQWGTGF